MNTCRRRDVQGLMGKWCSLGLVVLVGCANEIRGLGDEEVFDAEQPASETGAPWRSFGSVQVARGIFEVTEDAASIDTATSDLPDASTDTAGSTEVLPTSDSDLGEVDGGPDDGREDVCPPVAHHCPLTATSYSSCTPAVYSDALLAEQITHSKADSPASWIWSGVSTIQCDNYHAYPVASGTPCAHATVKTPSGLVEAVWCASGPLAGRFRKTADPSTMCPFGADPIAWW